ncbi:dihydropteroate synthase [Limosilactobacillus sp.]|uniref:dihydropteroate synthase n=1 Tax=Limosilactobacillus sp. TaxID=2773925 RepID=UPI00345EC7C2
MKLTEITLEDLQQSQSLAAAFLARKIQSDQYLALNWHLDRPEQWPAVKQMVSRLDVPLVQHDQDCQFCLPMPALAVLRKWMSQLADPELTTSAAEIAHNHQLIWQAGRFSYDLTTKPLVYGILNVTPDSFYDGGRYLDPAKMRSHIDAMVGAGADIIEVGGQSTRRDRFEEVAPAEEIQRIAPAIRYIHQYHPEVAIAVDTYKAPVLKAALRMGIDIANDVHGFQDSEMRRLVAESSVGLVTMYMAGNHDYDNLTADIHHFFEQRIAELTGMGIARERIALDEGIGYAAHRDGYQDFAMMRGIDQFMDLHRPLMVAISRKGFAKRLFNLDKKDRLPATLVAETYMALAGGRILRVHDIKETVQLVQLLEHIQSGYWTRPTQPTPKI